MSEAPAGQGIPVPQGDYLPATRHGALIFTAGMTPRRNGRLIHQGVISPDSPPESCRDAVVLACANALQAARSKLGPGERIASIPSMTVYIAAGEGFTAHSRLADFASDFLRKELGDAAIGSRCAVGVATLPGGAPVEIQLIAGV